MKVPAPNNFQIKEKWAADFGIWMTFLISHKCYVSILKRLFLLSMRKN